MSQSIVEALQWGITQLDHGDTPRLDAEILLAYAMQKSRSYLYTFPEINLSSEQEGYFKKLIERRMQGEPVPYLVGHQEFWSLQFTVTPDTLIPRPETELLVELVLQTLSAPHSTIADLGTGSGAIAISVAHERPSWIVHATDKSEKALKIALLNSQQLKIKNIFFHQGNWCDALPKQLFDAILSNPPYIRSHDPHLSQANLRHEPLTALASGEDGLDALREIIQTAYLFLKPNGYLLLEHGYDQSQQVQVLMKAAGYVSVHSQKDLSGIERVTMGKK